MAEAVIEARGLVKKYGELEAVRGIDLQVAPGEIFGFLGPNGAGKSTTISMLCTLLSPTAGTARVAGIDVVHDPARVRQKIGLVFQDPSLDDQLTGRENLEFHAFIYSVPAEVRRARGGDVEGSQSLCAGDLHADGVGSRRQVPAQYVEAAAQGKDFPRLPAQRHDVDGGRGAVAACAAGCDGVHAAELGAAESRTRSEEIYAA